MANEFQRSPIKAKGKALRINSEGFDSAIEFTASSSGGTIDTVATSDASLNVTLNGTAYRIPLFA